MKDFHAEGFSLQPVIGGDIKKYFNNIMYLLEILAAIIALK
jgi:hypothetical protein